MSDKKLFVYSVLAILFIVFTLLMTSCRNNVYPQSFEGAVCNHLLDLDHVKQGAARDQIRNECVELTMRTESRANSQGEGELYHQYLTCVLASPTFMDAKDCRAYVGWDHGNH